jgi:hypothetical protein
MGLRLIFSITFVVYLTTLLFLPFRSHALSLEASEIRVSQTWIRYNPMSGRSSAAYMEITNQGEGGDRLVGINVAKPVHAMMHQTIITDGITKMSHMGGMDIAAGAKVSFKPRGAHIMLMNMPTTLELGANLRLELVFASGKKTAAMFKLCPITAFEIC